MRTVLFVDDDPTIAVIVRHAVVDGGADFSVVCARDGIEALSVLRAHEVSLVVTDLSMPRLDGFGLLAQMVEEFPHIPAIVMTAHNAPEFRQRATEARALAFVEKPVVWRDLLAQVRSMIDELGESGSLRGVSLYSFAQLVNLDRKTCTVSVLRKGYGEKGRGLLFFRDGELIDARTGDGSAGFEAACRVLSWTAVQITVRECCPVTTDVVRKPMNTVLMEAAHYADAAAAEPAPPAAPGAARVQETSPVIAPATSPRESADGLSAEDGAEIARIQGQQLSVSGLLDAGFESFRAGRWRLAERIWGLALAKDPNNRLIEYNLRNVRAKLALRREAPPQPTPASPAGPEPEPTAAPADRPATVP